MQRVLCGAGIERLHHRAGSFILKWKLRVDRQRSASEESIIGEIIVAACQYARQNPSIEKKNNKMQTSAIIRR